MSLLNGVNLRENVQLAGIPILWKTNLPDDDVRSVYLKLETDSSFVAACRNLTEAKNSGVSISFSVFSKAVDFREGWCVCFGLIGHLFLIYRTAKEWELLEARENEIRELREEQSQDRKVEQLVYDTEDNFLSVKMAESLNGKNYSEAVKFLRLRLELRAQNSEIRKRTATPGSLMRDAIKIFCCFPRADDGVCFLLEHFPWSWALFDFAKDYWVSSGVDRQSKLLEIDKIFGAVILRFQEDARIHKNICLFLERQGELKRAIKHCEICASRHLDDGTVNGFSGRLKRLKIKLERGINKMRAV